MVTSGEFSKTQFIEFASVECLYEDCEIPEPGAGPVLPDDPDGVWSDDSIWNNGDGNFNWTYANGTYGLADTKPDEESIVYIKTGKKFFDKTLIYLFNAFFNRKNY